MHQDNFLLQEGKEKLIEGIAKATSLLKGTYGAAGGNVFIEREYYPFYEMSNDGKKIVDSVKLADWYQSVGANVMKEAGDKADKDSGDGRKTTMILTEAILRESAKLEGVPMATYRSLQECLPAILKSLDDQTKEITVEDVQKVAVVSSEDETTGRLIGEIYGEIGKDGMIEVYSSGLSETFYEITDGVRLRGAKYFGEYALTEAGKAIQRNPVILISKEKIVSTDQLDPLITKLKQNGVNQLVIYCDEIDMSVASRLALTHLQGGFKTLIVKAPVLWKDWLFEDFAKITGATPIDTKEGKTFKNLALQDLGTCETLIVTKEETRVIGIKDISEHLASLDDGTEEGKLRSNWLQTKTGLLKIGGNSETELAYKMKKAKDACSASYHALNGGVVVGGGLALYNAIRSLQDAHESNGGARILKEALQYPIMQIIRNTGMSDSQISDSLLLVGESVGYDAKTSTIADMLELGILDPATVVKNAITNAVSIASTVLTSVGVSVTMKSDEQGNVPVLR